MTELTYDALGNTLKKAYSNGTYETMRYDANSNLIETTDAMGNVTRYAYDFNDRLTSKVDALGYERITTYTKDGQISSITDGNGNKTSYEYNLLGQVTKEISGLGNEVAYAYDAVGNLKGVHQFKGVTASTISLMQKAPSYTTELNELIIQYEYNSNGQLTKEVNPSGSMVLYTYDANGNMSAKTDEDGYLTTYDYDNSNNLTSITYASGKQVSYTYNPNNQITSMTDWLGTTTYDLDVLGRLKSVKDFEGRVTSYTWNSRNQKLSMTYPDGSVVKYNYDIIGNLLKVLDANGKETVYTYDALDRMLSEVLPNGVKTTRVYDALSRITNENSVKKDGSIIYRNTYKLDGEGNILSETEKVFENKLVSYTRNYLYDSCNQLIQMTESTGIMEKYFYDTLGNRIQKETTNLSQKKPVTSVTRYTYNNDNQQLTLQGPDEEVAGHKTSSLVNFTYDNRGNIRRITTVDGTIGQYYYDDTNKMTYSVNKMGVASAYTYDGAGRRVKQAIEASNINVPETSKLRKQTLLEDRLNSEQHLTIDSKKELNYIIDTTSVDNAVLMVYGEQTKTQRYTYGNDLISLDTWNDKVIAWKDVKQTNRDKLLYYVQDFRGSVRALVDDRSKLDKTYDYNAFGTPIEKNHVNDQGIRSNIYHYAGYIYDYATSLYFVNARYYMPETGRFMARDAYKGDGLNRYVYVRNNPLIYVDPTGYCGEGAQGYQSWLYIISIIGVDPIDYNQACLFLERYAHSYGLNFNGRTFLQDLGNYRDEVWNDDFESYLYAIKLYSLYPDKPDIRVNALKNKYGLTGILADFYDLSINLSISNYSFANTMEAYAEQEEMEMVSNLFSSIIDMSAMFSAGDYSLSSAVDDDYNFRINPSPTQRTLNTLKTSELNTTHSITMSKNKFKSFVETIKNEGIKEPIKYVEHNGQKYVVDGHHRLQAAKQLGIKDVPVQKVELPYAGYKTVDDLFWGD